MYTEIVIRGGPAVEVEVNVASAFSASRCRPRGVWGHAPPGKFLKISVTNGDYKGILKVIWEQKHDYCCSKILHSSNLGGARACWPPPPKYVTGANHSHVTTTPWALHYNDFYSSSFPFFLLCIVPWLLSCRLGLAIISFLGFVNLHVLRVNISVGIVCMVNYTALDQWEENTTQGEIQGEEELCERKTWNTTGSTLVCFIHLRPCVEVLGKPLISRRLCPPSSDGYLVDKKAKL